MRIEPLGVEDAAAVAELLGPPDADLRRFFDGLPRPADEIRSLLAAAREDRYWAIHLSGELAGIFMLRGLDSGYAVPAFGVVIAERFRGRGLGRLALQFCETWCRLQGIAELMLTVAPENRAAVALYEKAGFVFANEHSPKGNAIYRKRLRR